MATEERMQKAMHRLDSAILHMEALREEVSDDEVTFIIGHLKAAQEKLHALHFSMHNSGKKIVQQELFLTTD